MRFSLRGMLLAFTYVALVVGAITARNNLIADAVWLATILAIVYAAVVTLVGCGIQRARAFGFMLLAVLSFAGMLFIPDRLPARGVIAALGYRVSTGVRTGGALFVVEERFSVPIGRRRRLYLDNSESIVSTAHAVETMIAGLIGAGIGALAYKNSKRE
jgi:hypothetical protein